MAETAEKRWYRWDRWMNEGRSDLVIEEFDRMVKNKKKILIGDFVRKNQALEEANVTMLNFYKINKEK